MTDALLLSPEQAREARRFALRLVAMSSLVAVLALASFTALAVSVLGALSLVLS